MTEPGNGEPTAVDLDAIYDALENDEPALALDLARQALVAVEDDDPVLRYLCGVALLELDRPADAVDDLRRAAELDPDDAEFRAGLARALFRCCDFDAAERETARALDSDVDSPDANYVRALLLERQGRDDVALSHFRRAARLDPERFEVPLRMSSAAFEGHLRRAVERLPERFRQHLDRVTVTVEELPTLAVLLDEDPPFDPENLLGLFVGTALDQCSSFGPPAELPPRILLFQRNLERMAADEDELAEQIAVTLYHELGHYLGLDEAELANIDLA